MGNSPLVRQEDEQALLGTLIVNPRAFAQIASITKADHFTVAINAELFEAIEAQCSAGMPASLPSLEFHFKDRWKEKIPGTSLILGRYASDLIGMAKPFDFVGMAHELKQLWALREMTGACETGKFSEGLTPKAALTSAFSRLEEIRAALAESETREAGSGSVCVSTLDRVRSIQDGSCVTQAATTGLADLDREAIGYRPGTVWTVAGRPGMGKTAFATSSFLRVAASGVGAMLFSLELTRDDIGARMLSDWSFSSTSPIPFSDIMRGTSIDSRRMTKLEAAKEEIDQIPGVIDDGSNLTLFELGARIRMQKRKMAAKGVRLGVVFIDFLKYLNVSDRYKGNRALEIGEIMRGLRLIAKEHEVCVVLLAQLNRAVESRDDKRPDLSDLRDSGEIEQDSDVVVFLYREAYYLEKSKEVLNGDADACQRLTDIRNEIQLIVAKNRGGRVTTVKAWCDITCSAIRDAFRSSGYGRAIA
jgi:replicative DNA helicase